VVSLEFVWDEARKSFMKTKNLLLQAALDIEDMENLLQQHCNRNRCRCRWNAHSIIIDYFFSFSFSRINKRRSLVYIKTPLFRVRNKKETIYCYSEEERRAAIEKLNQTGDHTI
jgi:topoisomerase-4 subunit B